MPYNNEPHKHNTQEKAYENQVSSKESSLTAVDGAKVILAGLRVAVGFVPIFGTQLGELLDIASSIVKEVEVCVCYCFQVQVMPTLRKTMQDLRAAEDALAKKACATLKVVARALNDPAAQYAKNLAEDLEQVKK